MSESNNKNDLESLQNMWTLGATQKKEEPIQANLFQPWFGQNSGAENGDTIKIGQFDIDMHSADYHAKATNLEDKEMNPTDNTTTISANKNSKTAYKSSKLLLGSLGEMIDGEAKTIKKTGVDYETWDRSISNKNTSLGDDIWKNK